jgi:hypothetical protein
MQARLALRSTGRHSGSARGQGNGNPGRASGASNPPAEGGTHADVDEVGGVSPDAVPQAINRAVERMRCEMQLQEVRDPQFRIHSVLGRGGFGTVYRGAALLPLAVPLHACRCCSSTACMVL